MSLRVQLRATLNAARLRDALWVRLLDGSRLLVGPEGLALAWTRALHGRELHQIASYTWVERYPEVFDLAARLVPNAARILSFGCSTGEELISLRRRFRTAEIVGAEINPRSRAIARLRVARDERTTVIAPQMVSNSFDIVFALSVLQRDPRGIAEKMVENKLAARYPFERFDAGVTSLVAFTRRGGLLCVTNALYRVEDSSAARELDPLSCSPTMDRTVLGPDGKRLQSNTAHTIFRKIPA